MRINKTFLATLIVGLILLLLASRNCVRTHENTPKERVLVIYRYETPPEDWEAFTKALIYVESKGDSLAVGSKDDVGVLQLRKIYVDEVNRILGDSVFSYHDRYSKKKSIMMFNVMQDYYNKDKNLHYALKLHNPYAPISYHKKVMEYYKKIKEE